MSGLLAADALDFDWFLLRSVCRRRIKPPQFCRTGRETVVEVFYKAQLSPTISLQPDIQYIASPSGIHSDSLAVGVRFQMNPAQK